MNRSQFYLKCGCHPQDSILIILEGEFVCQMGLKHHKASQNTVFVFNQASYFERHVFTPLRCVYIQFDKFPIPLPDGPLQFQDGVRLCNTVLYLEQAIKENKQTHIRHFIDDIFLMYDQGDKADIVKDELVSACMDLFNRAYSERITMDSLAKDFHVSKQRLIQKFRKHTNTTPMAYLNAMRLDYGKKLLRDCDLPIGMIAEQCGFDNVYYFSNAFKKYAGLSPSRYRAKFRI